MENLAIFANKDGGILIIGISNTRVLIGVDNPENKIQQSSSWISLYMPNARNIIKIITLPINNGVKDILILLFIIKQSKNTIPVINGISETYVIRDNVSLSRVSSSYIDDIKKTVADSNYLFMREIFDFVYNNKRI
jgi:predicted HTH transcriptional regulator